MASRSLTSLLPPRLRLLEKRRARKRWLRAQPDRNLTWGYEVSGDAFVAKAEEHGAFGPGKAVLEVGPGYGRLLAACLERGVEFGHYLGVDLSSDNVRYLAERFTQPNVRFICADAETVALDEPIDSLISSLTLKHLFPSFERALVNLARRMRPGGLAVFDLIEGDRRYFERDGVTYIRWYMRPEVEAILDRAGLRLVAYDEVLHIAQARRLLVVARRPGEPGG
jgi:SAM-dependent methyltransferase